MTDRPLHPMSTFNPAKPAELYDELNDEFFDWKPEWAKSWRGCSNLHDPKRGIIEWDGILIPGWREPSTG